MYAWHTVQDVRPVVHVCALNVIRNTAVKRQLYLLLDFLRIISFF